MAALAGSGSWLTLISGVAAGVPSGGGEGLLFSFAGVLSLWRQDKKEPGERSSQPLRWDVRIRRYACDGACARADALGSMCGNMCVHMYEHADQCVKPRLFSSKVYPQRFTVKMQCPCVKLCDPVHENGWK